MACKIPVYIPNISTDKLIGLLSTNTDLDRTLFHVEVLEKGATFRAPDIAVFVLTDDDMFMVKVVQSLIEAARLLGATQFSIEHEGFDMRLRPTNLHARHIELLLIASRTFKIDRINIF